MGVHLYDIDKFDFTLCGMNLAMLGHGLGLLGWILRARPGRLLLASENCHKRSIACLFRRLVDEARHLVWFTASALSVLSGL